MIHIDFETRSTVDLKKRGADVYARSPETEVVCLAWSYGDEVFLWTPKMGKTSYLQHFLSAVESGRDVCAHNAHFEMLIWNYVCVPKYGFPPLKIEQTYCTMAMAYAMALPGSLEEAAAALGISEQKDTKAARVMLQISKPRETLPNGKAVFWEDDEKYKTVYEYCKQDVRVEMEIFKRLLKPTARERKLWILDWEINQRGVEIAKDSMEKALELIDFEQKRLDSLMRRYSGGAVASCTAVSQIVDFLNWNGVETDSIAKAESADMLGRKDLPLKAREVLELRKEAAKSSTAKLKAMKLQMNDDNRVRSTMQYHGSTTGRFAGRKIQVQNFPRGTLSEKEVECFFDLLTEGNTNGVPSDKGVGEISHEYGNFI